MRHSVSIINGTYSQYELTSLLAPEDCASRSLVKNEIQGEGEEGHPEDISGEQLLEDDNEETLKNDNTPSSQDEPEETRGHAGGPKLCEYLLKKQKNIEELRRKLDEVNAQFPMLEELEQKKKSKPAASRKKTAHPDEPVVRRESLRNKDKKYVLM